MIYQFLTPNTLAFAKFVAAARLKGLKLLWRFCCFSS